MKTIKFDPIKDIQNTVYKGKINLDIADSNHKKSYFSIKNKYIRIETLTPTNNFDLCNIYHVFLDRIRYLVVHISDNTTVPAKPRSVAFTMNIKLEIKQVENCEITDIKFEKKEKVEVIIYNNMEAITCDKAKNIIINTHNKTKDTFWSPDEKGGGVIIEGP